MDPVAIVGSVAGVAAVLVAIWQIYGVPDRAVQQKLLDELPTAPPSGSEQEYFEKGMDWAGLMALCAVTESRVLKALSPLIRSNKVQVVIVHGISAEGHPSVPAGASMRIPLFFKGGVDPSQRASFEEVDRILKVHR